MPIRQKHSFMIGVRSDTRLFADNDSSAASPPGYQNAPATSAAFNVWPAFFAAKALASRHRSSSRSRSSRERCAEKIRELRHIFSLSANPP
jgi:hypothetical protein